MTRPQGLLAVLGFPAAHVTSLHCGISETFLPDDVLSDRKIVVKTLLENRLGDYSSAGEMAWLTTLAQHSLPVALPYYGNDWRQNIIECNGQKYQVYKYIDGIEPNRNNVQNYMVTGKILRSLHDVFQNIVIEPDDVKNRRPLYNADFLVGNFFPK